MNNYTCRGNMTKEPEIRVTGNGKKVANFTVAVDSGYGDSKKTEYIDCVRWGYNADYMEKYGAKGVSAFVSGELYTEKYTNRDGVEVKAWKVNARELTIGVRTEPASSGTWIVNNTQPEEKPKEYPVTKQSRVQQWNMPTSALNKLHPQVQKQPEPTQPSGFEVIADENGDLPF